MQHLRRQYYSSSKSYLKKTIGSSNDTQGKYFTPLTILNLLTILIVLWMTFVIMIDRVIPNWF